jgi:hypothetical protein
MLGARKRPRHEVVSFDIEPPADEWGSNVGIAIGDGNETPMPEPVEEDLNYYVPCELPSRRRERKRLGKPSSRDECFFCARQGERDGGTLPSSDVAKMLEMMHSNTGKMDTTLLAEQVANYYAGFRARINPVLVRNRKPELPPMSAATVAKHLRMDHHDPEVKLVMRLDTVQEAIEEVTKCLMERNKKTRKRRGNKVQIDNLDKLIKLEMQLQRVDTSKMFGYSAGARINPNIHKQGAVASNTKNLLDYWRRGGARE